MDRLPIRAAAFFALAGLAATQTPAAVSANAYHTFVVGRFQDLQFQGDVEGALALLTDDVVVTGRGVCTTTALCVGKDAFRPEIARAARVHTRVTVVNLAVSPNMVVTRQEVRNDTIRAAGLDRVINIVTFEFRDDKIAALTAAGNDLSDPETAEFARRQAAAAAPVQPSAAISPPATGNAGLAYRPSSGPVGAPSAITAH